MAGDTGSALSGQQRPHPLAPLVNGVTVALAGHLVVVAAVQLVMWRMGAYRDVDLEAGGRFGVNLLAFLVYATGHTILLVAGILAPIRDRRFDRGLRAGWVGGWAVTVVAWFAHAAVWLPPVLQRR